MQQLIKERGKDEVVNVRPEGERLPDDRPSGSSRVDRAQGEGAGGEWPERTIYEITDEGRRTFRDWMDEALSTRAREFPEFPVAVSLLGLLTPEEALRQLEMRVAVLEDEVARIDSQFGRAAAEGLPRLFLLETGVPARHARNRAGMGPRGRRRPAYRSTHVERGVAPSVLRTAHLSARRRGARYDERDEKRRPLKGGQAPPRAENHREPVSQSDPRHPRLRL